jgi:uncharacterized membrane protein YfcA
MPLWLIPAFFGTALLYAAVGFGGGSTYSALLALAGTDFRVLPVLALACNIVVVTGGIVRFARAGEVPWRGALAVSLIAAPLAFLGGLTPIKEATFLALLGGSLVVAALALLLPVAQDGDVRPQRPWVMPLAAAPLGYLAGVVGIGGGIFLAPLLHLTRWDSARRIAATASVFILINSLAGLFGQLAKSGAERFGEALAGGLPLLIAVAVGGQIGSILALRRLPTTWIRRLTAALTGWVGLRLLLG